MIVINGYVVAAEKADDNYEVLIQKIKNAPTAQDGYMYRLRADTLEWELVELPPMPEPEDEPTVEDKAEAYDILMGVTP